MGKTHDEQAAELFGYQAEIAMMKRRVDNGSKISVNNIMRLKIISNALPALDLAMNHYPEIKVPMFNDIKNLLLSM